MSGEQIEFPADAWEPVPAARPRSKRMFYVTCSGCGERFTSFAAGIRCDDCRKQARARARERRPAPLPAELDPKRSPWPEGF